MIKNIMYLIIYLKKYFLYFLIYLGRLLELIMKELFCNKKDLEMKIPHT